MIYKNIPKRFNPRFEIVSCYVEYDGKILLLHRHAHKLEGNRWGVPAGKIASGESELDAMVREIEEETGQELSSKTIRISDESVCKIPGIPFCLSYVPC